MNCFSRLDGDTDFFVQAKGKSSTASRRCSCRLSMPRSPSDSGARRHRPVHLGFPSSAMSPSCFHRQVLSRAPGACRQVARPTLGQQCAAGLHKVKSAGAVLRKVRGGGIAKSAGAAFWKVRRAATAFLGLGLAVLADAKPRVSARLALLGVA